MSTALRNHGWQQILPSPLAVMPAINDLNTFGVYGTDVGQFARPYGVAFSPDGALLAVAEWVNARVQLFSVNDGAIAHFASFGSRGSEDGQFSSPTSATFSPDGSRIVVSDVNAKRVQIFGISGNSITHQVSYGSVGNGDGQFQSPCSAVFSPDGLRIAVADSATHRIQLLGLSGNTLSHQVSYGAFGTGSEQFNSPVRVFFGSNDLRMHVVDKYNCRLQSFNVNGNVITYAGSIGTYGSGAGQFVNPTGAAYTNDGRHLTVLDGGNDRMQIFGVNGPSVHHEISLDIFKGGFPLLSDIAFNPASSLLVMAAAARDSLVYI